MSMAKKNNAMRKATPAVDECRVDMPKRFTLDGDFIYRPTRYPFEMVEGNGYVIQLAPFIDTGDYIGDGDIHTTFVSQDNDTSEIMRTAYVFDTSDEAIKFIMKHNMHFKRSEDGNIYPRVLKVRLSCIVEGVAFESTIREIEGGAKLEEVA